MKTGSRLGKRKPNSNISNKTKYPLVKIAHVICAATDLFSRDKVMLECGHEVLTRAIYKARCRQCYENKISKP